MKQTPNPIDPIARQLSAQCMLLRVGITGGIGSGKSYICKRLEEAGHRVFYCDDEAKRIMRTHPDVRRELTALVGPDLYSAEDASLQKSVMRAYLCQGEEYAERVNAVVHPRVAQAYSDFCREMAEQGRAEAAHKETIFPTSKEISLPQLQQLPRGRVAFMECALLFESGFSTLVERSVLVHVSAATQLKRVMQRDQISAERARQWIALQMSEEEKMRLADAVLVNE